MSTTQPLTLLRFPAPAEPCTSLPSRIVCDLRLEDFQIAQMYHHASSEVMLAVRDQLRAFYETAESHVYSFETGRFVPMDRWWTRWRR